MKEREREKGGWIGLESFVSNRNVGRKRISLRFTCLIPRRTLM